MLKAPTYTVVITGGAGTIGRAFVKYLQGLNEFPKLEPRKDYDIIVVDNNEWAIADMRHTYPNITYWLGEFNEYPLSGVEDTIIHAAAYKHVDLGESNVSSFVKNNIVKTMEFYEQASRTLARILYISTDKAVEPIGAYGSSKYLAELLTKEAGGTVARLGNILSSSGSVIPTWEAQIEAKEPITITDPAMTRYVIDDSEAVKQIWEQFLKGVTLIVPTMGEPVRLLDMMATVLKRHGYEKASDYTPGVTVIGMRPGEKLFEKLYWDNELV